MMQKLVGEGVVVYKAHNDIALTARGKRLAEELTRRHRVLADFFELLGVARELAELDACRIEHHVSPETARLLERFVEFLCADAEKLKMMEEFRLGR
jgi:DtxR family Mn-dependent transcriptional regulator